MAPHRDLESYPAVVYMKGNTIYITVKLLSCLYNLIIHSGCYVYKNKESVCIDVSYKLGPALIWRTTKSVTCRKRLPEFMTLFLTILSCIIIQSFFLIPPTLRTNIYKGVRV